VRDGPGALWMSCSRSGQGISTGVIGDGDRPLDWSREPGGECWSLGRRRQTGEHVRVIDLVGVGAAGDSGLASGVADGRRQTGAHGRG
jgi:hypothetical protein